MSSCKNNIALAFWCYMINALVFLISPGVEYLHILFDVLVFSYIIYYRRNIRFNMGFLYFVILILVYKGLGCKWNYIILGLFLHLSLLSILASVDIVDNRNFRLEKLVYLVSLSVVLEVLGRFFNITEFSFLESKEHLFHSFGSGNINLYSGVFRSSKQLGRFMLLLFMFLRPRLLTLNAFLIIGSIVLSGSRESILFMLVYIIIEYRLIIWAAITSSVVYVFGMLSKGYGFYLPSFAEIHERFNSLFWFDSVVFLKGIVWLGNGLGSYGTETGESQSRRVFLENFGGLDIERVADSGFIRVYVNFGLVGLLSYAFGVIFILVLLVLRKDKTYFWLLLAINMSFVKGHAALLDSMYVYVCFRLVREGFEIFRSRELNLSKQDFT